MSQELELMICHALDQGRIGMEATEALRRWYDDADALMASYLPDHDQPRMFEQKLLLGPFRNSGGGWASRCSRRVDVATYPGTRQAAYRFLYVFK
jgi:hypothetical protein